MEIITKYKAKDQTEFTTKFDCLLYEELIDRVNSIMGRLPKLPEYQNCDFANGHGYIQHDKEVLTSVWNDLLDEFKTNIKHHWLDQSKDLKVDTSWVGRLVSDYNISPYNKAWYRMICIDRATFREFGQPYYAKNPDKAVLFEIQIT